MKEAGSYRFQNGCLSFTFFRAYRYSKKKGLCNRKNGYGCGNQRKSGTIGYLLNQSSDEPSITTTGGEAKLRRQLRFLVASFQRPASQVGGLVSKLPSASVKSLSIIGRNGGEGSPSLLKWKGGKSPFTAAPLQLPFAQHDHERRQRIAQIGGRNEPTHLS